MHSHSRQGHPHLLIRRVAPHLVLLVGCTRRRRVCASTRLASSTRTAISLICASLQIAPALRCHLACVLLVFPANFHASVRLVARFYDGRRPVVPCPYCFVLARCWPVFGKCRIIVLAASAALAGSLDSSPSWILTIEPYGAMLFEHCCFPCHFVARRLRSTRHELDDAPAQLHRRVPTDTKREYSKKNHSGPRFAFLTRVPM